MKTKMYDVAVIGGGPAGMAAAIKACDQGCSVAIMERDSEMGGILNQCIHAGFGLQYFKEELTGPEYAGRFEEIVVGKAIDTYLGAMVTKIGTNRTLVAINREGILRIQAKAIVLAMGCRERTRGAIRIPGTRPAGVMTAGVAQRYINIENLKPGNKAVILGSGDIGLIMARRMHLEGIEVVGVYELMPYANGLARNVKQCLVDFGIPLYTSTTVVDILGKGRLTGVVVAKVDQNMSPISGTEEIIACDTLLLSVGLIPENDLSAKAGVRLNSTTNGPLVDELNQTNIPGVFACGNVLHVHDLVDSVTWEAERTGLQAALFAKGECPGEQGHARKISAGKNVGYTVPNYISGEVKEKVSIFYRVGRPITNGVVEVQAGDKVIFQSKPAIFKPGIMNKVILTGKILGDNAGNLVVSVREAK